jgi:hypothetical protein
MKEKELRMYYFVMRNIGEIDKGIQAGHCSDEYKILYPKSEIYLDWLINHKTYILLSGGVSNNGVVLKKHAIGNYLEVGTYHIDETLLGSMELYEKYLIENNIEHSSFREPDLNNSLTALGFVCDEKVFDWEEYPSFFNWLFDNTGYRATPEQKKLSPPYFGVEFGWDYKKWVELVGGENNAKKKELIFGKKLA